jgi:protein-L-isoaspartate(D-aspartate) O-methyltransferase
MNADFESERRLMVEGQIKARGVHDPRLLAAFEAVPRHVFVPAWHREYAYQDMAVPIGSDQTISQPYMVAVMTDLLGLRGGERVLEVGTGSGYQSAILSRMAGEVHTVEFIPALAKAARKLLDSMGLKNIRFHVGDGSLGWPAAAPYDGILVTAGAPGVPPPLLKQLADEGALVIPVKEKDGQVLQVWKRTGSGFASRTLFNVAFVPLRGKYGQK